MLAVVHLLTRRLFAVPSSGGRLALLVAVIGGVAVAGELLLPTDGRAGFAARALALAAIPLVLLARGFRCAAPSARADASARRRSSLPRRAPARRGCSSAAASRSPSPRLGAQRRRHVAPVAARAVAGQHERRQRAHARRSTR